MFTDHLEKIAVQVDPMHFPGFDLGYLRMALQIAALQQKKTAHHCRIQGFTTGEEKDLWAALATVVPDIHVAVKEHPATINTYTNNLTAPVMHGRSRNSQHQVAVFDSGYVIVSNSGYSNETHVNVGSLDEAQALAVITACQPFLTSSTGKAHISVIVMQGNGPGLVTVGEGGTPFIPGNYHPDAVDVFKHIAHDLAAPVPCGRLSILTGLPGVGKTYFLEGLIDAQKNCRFILLPPSIIMNVAAPDLLRVLLHDDDAPGRPRDGSVPQGFMPIVLIIEDADMCLTNRELDNLPAISAILNLADGILGRALDIRILATSNAKVKDIDKALLRDGRLCRSYDFKPLNMDMAQTVYQRECRRLKINGSHTLSGTTKAATGFALDTAKTMTLAEVYRAVKSAGATNSGESLEVLECQPLPLP